MTSVLSLISQAGATWRNRSTNAASSAGTYVPVSAWCETRPSRRLEVEAPRLALRAPAQLGVEPEIRAVQERRQEPRDLEAVLGRRAEEAQGAVDVEDVAVAHAPLDAVEQPVELEPAEELAIPRGLLVADLGPDQDRAEQDRLRQRDVVAIDQPLGRDVLEAQQAVLVAQVGEERGQHGVGLEVQLAGDRAHDLVAVERGALAGHGRAGRAAGGDSRPPP